MPGNSTAVRVQAHAKRKESFFKRCCLSAMVLTLLNTAYAQEEYSLDSEEAETGRIGTMGYTIRDGYAIAQGDMVLGRVDEQGNFSSRKMARGLGLNNTFGRWPNGVITYTISNEVSDEIRRNISNAVRQINSLTRITILERDAELAAQYPDNWIKFVNGDSCASYVGANAAEEAEQRIWVAPQCNTGSVVHEIAHTIGLFHEHTRPDRDLYITVLQPNVRDGSEHNFAVVQAGADNYSSYDYGSIMHYGEYFFSTDPFFKKTIQVPNGQSIGQRVKLSEKDISSINNMYATDLSLSVDVRNTGESKEISVSVSNNGNLGAHRIYARLALVDGDKWTSVSRDSGWDCTTDAEELTCTRDVLAAGETSRFLLLADADSTSADQLVAVIQTRTLDTRMSNNSMNDDGRWADLANILPDDHGASGAEQGNGESDPALAAGLPIDEADQNQRDASNASTTSSDDSSGGSGGGSPAVASLALLGLAAALRRRREQKQRAG